jgi:predicted MPP superfamily phosphohydrolase
MTLVRSGRVAADGWIPDYGAPGNRLYVNRGIGFSRVPIRINCPPELTWITLRRGG